ncbi:unnamed protein product, partial [Symbiodinium sp. CCMP2592]
PQLPYCPLRGHSCRQVYSRPPSRIPRQRCCRSATGPSRPRCRRGQREGRLSRIRHLLLGDIGTVPLQDRWHRGDGKHHQGTCHWHDGEPLSRSCR